MAHKTALNGGHFVKKAETQIKNFPVSGHFVGFILTS